MMKCERCGKELVWKGRGRKSKYCESCAPEVNRQRAREYDKAHRPPRVKRVWVPKQKPTQTCKHCGKEFNDGRVRTFCSVECRQRARTPMPVLDKICIVCGVSFVTKDKTRLMCSIKCLRKKGYLAQKADGKIYRARKICKCLYCGIEFRPKMNPKTKGLYCSRECAFKNSKVRFAGRTLERVGDYIVGASSRLRFHVCIVCNKTYRINYKSSRCCSDLCKKIRVQQRVYGTEKKYG
jgi:hypothetical protein